MVHDNYCQKCADLSLGSSNLSRVCGDRRCLAPTGWDDSEFEPHYGIKPGSMVFEVVAVVVVIRQYALKNCLWQMLLGANGK